MAEYLTFFLRLKYNDTADQYQMCDYIEYSDSIAVKESEFLIFRISQAQKEKIVDDFNQYKVFVDVANLLIDTGLTGWLSASNSNEIFDLRSVSNWYNYVIKTARPEIVD